MQALRTRWAALGAAVAVSLGAGGVGFVAAEHGDDNAAFRPIEPCRLADTRPATQVGPRGTPIGADETHTITAVGAPADCGVFGTATALSLNVTAIDPTEATFLTIWGGGPRPLAASLNPTPGQPPTPNSVITPVDELDRFRVYNRFGDVDLVVDVNGFFVGTDHEYERRRNEIYVSPWDFTALEAGWDVDGDSLTHIAGDRTCAVAGLDLPAGRTVIDMWLDFVNPDGPDDVEVKLSELGVGPGSHHHDVTNPSVEVPVAAGPFWDTVTLPINGDPVVADGAAYRLEVCTAGSVEFGSFGIILDF